MRAPPGPKVPPIVMLVPMLYRPFTFFRACQRRYGDTFTVQVPGLPPSVVFSHPDAVKEIFSLGPDDAHAGEVNAALRPLLGKYSLLLLDGKEHLRQRRLLLPPLHGERMSSYGARMIALTEASIEAWPEHARFPVHEELQNITLEVILRVVFGLADGERMDRMRKHLLDVLEVGTNPLLLLETFQRDFSPRMGWGKFLRASAAVDELLFHEVEQRKQTGARGDDILSLLLEARDEQGEPMSQQELRDELLTLLVAGHETTATSLSWALRWILDTPGLVQRLSRELSGEEGLTPERLQRAPLLDATIREALRLQPVVPMVGRRLQRPMRIGDYDLDAGTAVLASIYLVQRRPDLYPDPERFDPDRFLRQKFGPNEWFPFGGGIRRCIGMAFALYEMKMVLGTILMRAELRLPRLSYVWGVRRSVTIAPSLGMPVVLERRA